MQCNILIICISYGIMSSLANDEHPIDGYDEIDDNDLSERKLLMTEEPLRDYLGYYGEFISEKDSDWCPKKCESATKIYESPNLRSYCTCEDNKNTVKHDCPAHEIFNRTLGVCSQLPGGGTASCVLKNHNCPKNHRGLIAHPDSNLFQNYILCKENLVIVAICDDMYYYDRDDKVCKKLHIEDTYLSASDCPIIPGIECSEPGIIPMNNGQVFESQSLRCANCFYLCSVRDMDTFELKISCENITVHDDTENFRMGEPHSQVIEHETTHHHGGFSNKYGHTSFKSGSSSSNFDTEETTPKHKTRSESSTGETSHTSNGGDTSSPTTHIGENSKNHETIGNSMITENRGATAVDSTIEDGKNSISDLNNNTLGYLEKIKYERELGDLEEKHGGSGKTTTKHTAMRDIPTMKSEETTQKNTSTNRGGNSSITGYYGTTPISRTAQYYSTIISATNRDEGADTSEKEKITLKHSTVSSSISVGGERIKNTPGHKFTVSSITVRSDRITGKQFKMNSSSSSPFTVSGIIPNPTTSSSFEGETTGKHADIKSGSGSSIATREIVTPNNTMATISPTRNEEITLTTHDHASTNRESISSNFLNTDSGGTIKKHVNNGNSNSKIINNGKNVPEHYILNSSSMNRSEKNTEKYTTKNSGSGPYITETKGATPKHENVSSLRNTGEETTTEQYNIYRSSGALSISENNGTTPKNTSVKMSAPGKEETQLKYTTIDGDFVKGSVPKNSTARTGMTSISTKKHNTTGEYTTIKSSGGSSNTIVKSSAIRNGITTPTMGQSTIRPIQNHKSIDSSSISSNNDSKGSIPKHETSRVISGISSSSKIINNATTSTTGHRKTTDYTTINVGDDSSTAKSEKTIPKHNVSRTHETGSTTIYSTSNGSMAQEHTTLSSLSSSNGEGITNEYTTTNTRRGTLINEGKGSTGKKSTGSLPKHTSERSSTKSIHNHNSTNSDSSSINDSLVTGRDHNKTIGSLNTGRKENTTTNGGNDSSISREFTKSEETITKHNVPRTHATESNKDSKINKEETTTTYSTLNGSMIQTHTTPSSLSSSNGEGITNEYTTTNTRRGTLINEDKGSTGKKSTGSLPKHTSERSSTKSIHNHNSTNSDSSSINDSLVTGRDHNKTIGSLNTGRKENTTTNGGNDSSISREFTKSEETITKHNVPRTHATDSNNDSKINKEETTTTYSTLNGSMIQTHTTPSSLSSSNGEGITKEYTTINTRRGSLINEGKGSTGNKSKGSLPKHTTEKSSTNSIHNHNSTGRSSINDSLVTGQDHNKTTGRKDSGNDSSISEGERHMVSRTNAIDSESDKIDSEKNPTKYSTSSSSSNTRKHGTAQKYTTLSSSTTSNREEDVGEFAKIKSGSNSSTRIDGETIPKHTTYESKEPTEERAKNKIGTSSSNTGSKEDTSGNSSTSLALSSSDRPCPSKGFFRYNHSCSIHYECYYSERHQKMVASRLYECPNCLQFNARSSRCDLPENVPECSIHDPTYQYVEGYRITKPVKICTGPGIFADPIDSNNFYECADIFDENINYLTVSSCPHETHFNPRTNQCEREYVRQKNYNLLGGCKTNKYAFHKSSCQKFFYCVDDTKSVEMKCLDGYMFNGQFCQLKLQTVYCNWDPIKKNLYKRYKKYI